MRPRFHGLAAGLIALLLAVSPLPVTAQDIESRQSGGDTYESPRFGYVVQWDGQWAERDRDRTTGQDGSDAMVLSNNDGRVEVVGQAGDLTADEFLDEVMALLSDGDETVEVVRESRDGDVPAVELTTDRGHLLLEAQTVDDAVVVVSLRARDVDFSTALAAAQGGITLNGTPVLSGEVAAPNAEPAEEPTDEPVDPDLPDFDGRSAPPESTPETDPTPESNGASGLDGSTFTSPSFGFTLDVPDGWTIEDESISGGAETLVVSNGLSTISVHATAAYTGDLPGCIGYTRDLLDDDPVYADLRLDATSSGDPFQGSDDVRAFARFTYTGADGERWAHFVDCRAIVAGESVLIVSQDVPYDDYASERLARRQIQRAIEFP